MAACTLSSWSVPVSPDHALWASRSATGQRSGRAAAQQQRTSEIADTIGSSCRRSDHYLTPHWSPDGTTIVLHPVAENAGIWLVDSQTGSVRVKLAYTPASYEDDAPGSADIWSFERVSP